MNFDTPLYDIVLSSTTVNLQSMSFNTSELFLEVGKSTSLDVTFEPANASYKELTCSVPF